MQCFHLGISWSLQEICFQLFATVSLFFTADRVANFCARLSVVLQERFYIFLLITFSAAFFYHQFVEFNYQ